MLETINAQIERYFVKQKLYAKKINRSINNLPNFKKSLIKRIDRVNKDVSCIGMRAELFRSDYFNINFKGAEIDVDYDFEREEIRAVYIRGVDITEIIDENLEDIQELVSAQLSSDAPIMSFR